MTGKNRTDKDVWEWRIKKKNGEWSLWKKGRIGDWVFDKDTEYQEREINKEKYSS